MEPLPGRSARAWLAPIQVFGRGIGTVPTPHSFGFRGEFVPPPGQARGQFNAPGDVGRLAVFTLDGVDVVAIPSFRARQTQRPRVGIFPRVAQFTTAVFRQTSSDLARDHGDVDGNVGQP